MLLCVGLAELTSSLKNRILISSHQVVEIDSFTSLHLLPEEARAMYVFVILSIASMTVQSVK